VHRPPPVVIAALITAAVAGCSGPTVVNTDDGASSTVDAPPAPTSSTRPSNAHLANAFAYLGQGSDLQDGQSAYFFTTPSGRWDCAIVPRTRAGCQNSQGSSLGITGAPDEVPTADGGTASPDAIVVDRTADPQFVALDAPGLEPQTGTAAVLPFNRILAVGGFRCNVQEASGIACLSELSGKGFTFSADGYVPAYTDVPAEAP
jgi:hypothetical protein